MIDTLLHNIRICLEDGQVIEGELLLRNGKIASISKEQIEQFNGLRINGQGYLVLPGFIDQHIHGAVGADFMDGEIEATQKIARYLPSEGTTSFLATTMTHSTESIQLAVEVNKQYLNLDEDMESAEMLGFHLEGPFIHPKQAGAQPLQYIRPPSTQLVHEWFGDHLDGLKVVTLAPELDHEFELIRYLTKHSIISSAGHTIARFEEIEEANQHGLTHLTHFTNAMTGIHHREIGVVGAGFMNEDLFCEIIADGIHISKNMLKFIGKSIGPDRIILITDSMRAKGLLDGTYTLADQPVTVVGQKATLDNGTLAGSVLKMNDAVRLMQEICGWNAHDLQKVSSMNAAKKLGVYDRKGSITVGKDADLVLVNDDYDVCFTFCRGKLSYSNIVIDREEM